MTHRRPEHFTITKLHRRYDHTTGTFTINIAYKTAPPKPTKRVQAIQEAFGIGTDQTNTFTIYDNLKLTIKPTDIIYITGDSGSGKSTLLKALEKTIEQTEPNTTININAIKPINNKPIIETIGTTLNQAIELLSKVGLNDAFLFLRSYAELSDGQKYRYKTAKLIQSQQQYWILDEFASTLDRDTAKIVAYNLQKQARQQHKTILAATTHTDLLHDLNPTIHIHKQYGKQITVKRYRNTQPRPCSLTKQIHQQPGTTQDWQTLAPFHYRTHRLPAPRHIFTLKRHNETCAVIVYSYPPPACLGRKHILPKMTLKELNANLSTISRVVVQPKYRTIGLGTQLIKDTLALAGTEYVEMIAVMAKHNPFAEKAGMQRIIESTPSKQAQNAIEKLQTLGFNTILLSDHQTTLKTLNNMSERDVDAVKTILKDLCSHERAYGRRLFKTKSAFSNPQETYKAIDDASLEKLVDALKILSVLVQKKVYLLWKKGVDGLREKT